MLVNGGDVDSASVSDYLLHFITFGLKVGSQWCFIKNMMLLVVRIIFIIMTSTKVFFASIIHNPY